MLAGVRFARLGGHNNDGRAGFLEPEIRIPDFLILVDVVHQNGDLFALEFHSESILSRARGLRGLLEAKLIFELLHLRNAPAMPLDIGKMGVEVRAHQLSGEFLADDARA